MIIIKFLILVFSSIGYISFLHSYGKVRATAAPLLYISFVVLFLYCFAIFGQLHLGMILSLGIGISLGASVVLKKKMALLNNLKLNAILCSLYAIPFVIFYTAISSDFLFTGWDEFSFWGPSIKLIYETDSLYLSDSAIVFKSYPPAQQLFQYYFTSATSWSEKNILFAQIIFILSSLMCVAGSFCGGKSFVAAAAYLASCSFLYFFGYDFTHIFVDPLLAVYFAACIGLALTVNSDGKGAFTLCLVLSVLVLIKAIGLILSFVVILLYASNLLFSIHKGKVAGGYSWSNYFPAIALFFCSVSVFLAFKSWSLYVESIGASKDVSIPKLVSFFQEPMLQRLSLTVVEFLERIHSQKFMHLMVDGVWRGLSIFDVTAFLAFSSIALVFLYKKVGRLSLSLSLLLLFFCAFGYLAFLLLSYLLFFTEYEGTRLASFERYAATYYLAWLLILYAIFCGIVESYKRKILSGFFVLSSFFMVCYVVSPQFFVDIQAISSPAVNLEKRQAVDKLAGLVKNHIKKGEKAYFIIQDSTGYEKYMFNYAMVPYHSVWWCWSIGEKYRAEDVWTCDKKLEDLLLGYSYLAIYYADDKFWHDNSYLFEASAYGKTSGVFKVIREEGEGEGEGVLLKEVI